MLSGSVEQLHGQAAFQLNVPSTTSFQESNHASGVGVIAFRQVGGGNEVHLSIKG